MHKTLLIFALFVFGGTVSENVRDEISSLGLWTTDGTHKTLWETRGYSDYGVRCNYPPNINYNVYMKKSHTIYSIGKGQWPKNNGKITKYSQLPW